MGTNRYTNLTPSKFNPLSLQEIMMVPLAKQKQHDAAQQAAIDQGIFDVDRLNVDDPLISGEIDRMKQNVTGIEDELMSKGVSRGLTKRLMEARRERENFLSQDGQGGQAIAAYQGYQANVKSIEGAKDINQSDKDRYLQFAQQRYKGISEGDTYQQYRGADFHDAGAAATKFAEEMTPVHLENAIINDEGLAQQVAGIWRLGSIGEVPQFIKNNFETISKDPRLIQILTTASLLKDQSFIDYQQAFAESSGIPPELQQQYITEQAASYGSIAAAQKKQNDAKFDQDRANLPAETTTTTTNKINPYVSTQTPDVTPLSEVWEDMDHMRDAASKPGKKQDDAIRMIDDITTTVLNNPKNKFILDNYYNEMNEAGLDTDVLPIEDLGTWKITSKHEGIQKDKKNYILARNPDETDENGSVTVFQVSDSTYKEYKRQSESDANYLSPYKMLTNRAGQRGGEKSIIKQSKVSINGLNKEIDSYFNNVAAPNDVYRIEQLAKPKRDQVTHDIQQNLKIGGINSFEILKASKAEKGGQHQPIRTYSRKAGLGHKKQIFDNLQTDSNDFKMDYVYMDEYTGVPAMRVSFVKGTGDNAQSYNVDIALDKLMGKGGVKSGELAMLSHMKNYGGPQGKQIYDYMVSSIKYKDARETRSKSNFSESNDIKALNPGLFSKNEKVNIWKNEGLFSVNVKGSDGKAKTLRWSDVIKPGQIRNSEINPQEEPEFYNALIKHAISKGYIDADLGNVLDENGQLDDTKIDDQLELILDFDEVFQVDDRISMLNILSNIDSLNK